MNVSTPSNGKKKWGRRLGCAIFAVANVNYLIILGCLGKIPWEWAFKFSGLIVAIALLTGGVLTITDALALWKAK